MKVTLSGPINNTPALVQIMTRHWTGHKPLSEPTMVYCTGESLIVASWVLFLYKDILTVLELPLQRLNGLTTVLSL